MNIEEKILIKEIRKRNYNVYKTLFAEYYPFLLRYAEGFVFDRQVCEDIVQNIFIHIWENADAIKITSSLKSYFYTSVKNRCLNHLRSLQISDKHKLLYLEAAINSGDPSNWEDSELVDKIKNAIEKLPEKMSEIFKLKYLDGKKNKEISDLLEISENTIKTQLQRAKTKIRELLLQTTSLNFIL